MSFKMKVKFHFDADRFCNMFGFTFPKGWWDSPFLKDNMIDGKSCIFSSIQWLVYIHYFITAAILLNIWHHSNHVQCVIIKEIECIIQMLAKKNPKKPTIVANSLKRDFIIHGQTEFMIGKYQQTGYDWKILNASKVTHLLKDTLLIFQYCQVLLNPFVWHASTSRCRKHHVLTFFMSDIVPYSYLSFVVCR